MCSRTESAGPGSAPISYMAKFLAARTLRSRRDFKVFYYLSSCTCNWNLFLLKDFLSFLFILYSKTIEPNLVSGLCLFTLDKIYLGSPCIAIGLKVSISSFKSLKPPSPRKGKVGILWAIIWTHSSSFCSLWKVKQFCQISLYLTRKSALYSSVVVRRIFCFPLVLAIDASTGFFTCSFDVNS